MDYPLGSNGTTQIRIDHDNYIPRYYKLCEELHKQAARRAQIAGFDAVEIHAGHSCLLSHFIFPLINDREDEFGGSVENRARLARMVFEEVRLHHSLHQPAVWHPRLWQNSSYTDSEWKLRFHG